MAKRKEAVKITASEKQTEIIKKMAGASHLEKHFIDRAKIICLALENKPNTQIAKILQIERNTVKQWRKRWAQNQAIVDQTEKDNPRKLEESIKNVFEDVERSGRKPIFSQEQKAKIVAISLQEPKSFGLPISNWTHSEISETAAKLEIVKSISVSQVGRFLKYGGHKSSSI